MNKHEFLQQVKNYELSYKISKKNIEKLADELHSIEKKTTKWI